MGQNLFLLHNSDLHPITKFAVTAAPLIVGRSRQCEVYLNDVTVSRRHAELVLQESVLNVTDLKSRNGTFVDDERVQSCRIYPGQRIRFGAVTFLLTDRDFDQIRLNEDLDTRDPRSAGANLRGHSDREKLSGAQLRVLDLLLDSLSEKQIANRLAISRHTVHNHVREIYKELGVHTRPELMLRFLPRSADV